MTFGEARLRLSPPRGTRLETARRFDVATEGAESDVAVAAARLGVDAAWLSKLPDSAVGRRVVGELRSHGVRTGVVWSDDGRLGTSYYERGTEPRETCRVHDPADATVATTTAEELPLAVVRQAETFFTSGATPARSETLARTTATLLETAADAGTTTALALTESPNRWSAEEARTTYESLLGGVDVCFADRDDLEAVLNVDGDAAEMAHHVASTYDVRTVVVTLGDGGALGLRGGEAHEQRAYDAETVDATGSDDAFVGGFLARSHRGGSMAESLSYGAATAALARTVEGPLAVVTRDDVERLVGDDPVEG